jgi:hypothetical protein
MRRSRSFALALCTAVAVASADAAGGQGRNPGAVYRLERIVGQVLSDSGAVILGAEVIVTRGPDRAVRRDTTGSDGRFSIVWSEGTGDYLVYVTAPGRATFRQRVQRSGYPDSVFTLNVVLASAVTQLAPVAVTAARIKPQREQDPSARAPGAADWSASDDVRILAPDQVGDLNEMAATLPGMIRGPDGISALGLGSAQNQITLDGLAFAGGNIPREARVFTRVATAAYDPTLGGFSGAQTSLDFWGGGLFSRANGSISLDAPALQLMNAAARALGAPFLNLRLSAGADGPWGRTDTYRYNVSAQVSRRTADAVSLLDSPVDVLRSAGVSPDSAAALERVLDQLGIPRAANGSAVRMTEQVTVLGRFDRTGFDWNTREDRPRSGAITAYVRLKRSDGVGLEPTSVRTVSGSSEGQIFALQGLYSVFAGENRDHLFELRSSYSIQTEHSEPRLVFPAGQVLVGPELSATTAGALTMLRFGGNSSRSMRRYWSWETRADAQWYASRSHLIKVMAQSRFDMVTADPAANRSGTFIFNSLADLAAGNAVSYLRVLNMPKRSGGVWNGALAAGDFWRPHPRVEVVYGARFEANRFTTKPALNAEIAEFFGARTDFTPNRLRISPRFGFTWNYSRRNQAVSLGPASALGVSAVRPTGVLRGGVGEFRSIFSPNPIAEAVGLTGLPDGMIRLLCVGNAVPTPAWTEFVSDAGAVPTVCAPGHSNLVDAAPPVMLIDPHFEVPRSWRANLALTTRWRSVFVNVDGIVSLNRRQPGTVDLNLPSAPVARLASEGDRPLYVPISAIMPQTGAILPAAGRRDARYGQVASLRSDLRSTSRQLMVSLQPDIGPTSRFSIAYTLGSVQSGQRGFDGAAFGDPSVQEVARGNLDVRHQFVVSGGKSFAQLGGTTFTIFGVFQSGYPYTPLIAGDVNGDGRANDRAFVHAPGAALAAGDTLLASNMEALLAEAPAHARRCLERQLGRAAARSSCEGPWTATANARIDLPLRFLGTGIPNRRRVRVAINLANLLGGLDQVLRGSTRLRGWGVVAVPEQTLYTVSGFDPAAQRFRYRVNPRFGRTDLASSILRTPFRATLDFSVDLGRPVEVQQVERFLAPGRSRPGPKLDSAALHTRYARNVPNVFRLVLRDADSLFLTPLQIDALEREERAYLLRVNRLWGEMAGEFARLSDRFDPTTALRRQEDFIDQAWEISRDGALRIRDMLTLEQFPLTNGTVQYLANEPGRIRIRLFQ